MNTFIALLQYFVYKPPQGDPGFPSGKSTRIHALPESIPGWSGVTGSTMDVPPPAWRRISRSTAFHPQDFDSQQHHVVISLLYKVYFISFVMISKAQRLFEIFTRCEVLEATSDLALSILMFSCRGVWSAGLPGMVGKEAYSEEIAGSLCHWVR